MLWETMIFGGPLDQCQWRYRSRGEALVGHAAAILLALEQQQPPKGDDAMLIRFTSVGDFLEELKKQDGVIEARVVRVSRNFTVGPPRGLDVVATAIAGQHILRLDFEVGEYEPGGDEQVLRTAFESIDEISARIRSLNFEVRAGIVEP